MTIGRKITGGYLIILVLLAIVAIIGIVGFNVIENRYSHFLDVDEKMVDASNMLLYETANQPRYFRAYLLYEDTRAEYKSKLEDTFDSFNDLIDTLKAMPLTQEGIIIVNDIEDLGSNYQSIMASCIALVEQGDEEGAMVLAEQSIKNSQEAEALIAKVEDFRELQQQIEAEERASVDSMQRFLTILIIVASALAFISGTIIAIMLSRNISRQLRETTTQLASSSAELSAAASQLASGATETATAVSQTTTTVEEVKQAAGVASGKAKYVSDSSQKATQAAHSGRKAVEESTEAMQHIQEQMGAIAEGIVRLSEQSATIGEITAAVTDIAEQSNLLAVNAAIEAAKAGEQGKGFAVVAQEVKSLSEQSKQATAQVKAILGDVQKGINAAVMLTEQGGKAADAGAKQSAEAGEAIQALVASVTEAAQAATQIAASSQQQVVGMEQIASAMESIKQASTESVISTQQTESTARNLHDLSEKLLLMVEKTKGA